MIPEYNLKVSAQELQVLVGALHEAPYRIAAPLINKFQAQINDQEAAAQKTGASEAL